MSESRYGSEDARGHWVPEKPISYGPAFAWPPQPRAVVKWFFGFPGYLLPWNVPYALLAIFIWLYLTPPLAHFRHCPFPGSPSCWPNLVLAYLSTGVAPVALCLAEAGTNSIQRKWPDENAERFTFNNQTYDNMFWTLASEVPIWTCYEVLLLWGYANGCHDCQPTENPLGLWRCSSSCPSCMRSDSISPTGCCTGHRSTGSHTSSITGTPIPGHGRGCRCIRSSM